MAAHFGQPVAWGMTFGAKCVGAALLVLAALLSGGTSAAEPADGVTKTPDSRGRDVTGSQPGAIVLLAGCGSGLRDVELRLTGPFAAAWAHQTRSTRGARDRR